MENRYSYLPSLIACALLACAFFCGSQSAQATQIEKWLIMPAPVTSSHAEFEEDCSACHAPLSDVPQGELCVACHTEVGDDLTQDSGFHGRLPESQRFDCASCHTDHEGRDMNIVELDKDSFDHALTDFALHGAHSVLACGDCHAADSKHRDAPSQCIDCHQADDVHKGLFGKDCGSCHGDSSWSATEFDHSRTRFPLTGAHVGVTCDACHEEDHLEPIQTTCVSCHEPDDVHKGRNGTECASCHSTGSWTDVKFEHFLVTGFGLKGGHKGLACEACHRGGDFKKPGNSDCSSCHLGDDVHKGRFGTDCRSCHSVVDWGAVLFNHERETGVALPPGHTNLACTDCHTGNLQDALPTTCGNCHADDDVHKGQLGDRCESCHAPTSWVTQVLFDHDITSFPLVGAHADIACNQCHATAAFHDADSECVSCHGSNDPHMGGLGGQCDTCHNPASWRAWEFDHNKQTSFPLTGSHNGLACNECHTGNVGLNAEIPQDCNSCHRRDDPHFGRFGNNCEACHTTSSFTQIEGM